ncbi:MAG: acetylglutamate kinase [Methanosphaera sp.]|uniref:acetylglutamate kinase n=1 Tax=Methanosphaera sp. TaxID=2666342 RepID=UPI0025E010D1|nr:acetylglutamate kinase [Methanosphaera sp.]MCI5866476.1 acetylglutamate kinase [Methanosphaera sp.]MDD6534921.1 acetylglutamate kinase [Methanosphaera sp.]MDY3955380.1 acetylglutamate kinase [Methanosphaera sp.]
MNITDVLIEALPYIKKFHDKKIMIKYGGHAMIDENAMSSTARDTVLLKYVGMQPLVVHGGGPEISRSMDKVGKEPKFINGLRVTDAETMDIIKMVLVGKINTEIMSKICLHGGKSLGITGKDSFLVESSKKEPTKVKHDNGEVLEVDLGYVGKIDKINTKLVDDLTSNDYIPVISPIGIDKEGNSLNLNADTVAGSIASAIDAEKLIILTDVPGLLADPDDPESLIRRIRTDELRELIKDGTIAGGMIPKIETCINAVENGVKTAHILDGRLNHSILLEIFTKHGIGTMVRE